MKKLDKVSAALLTVAAREFELNEFLQSKGVATLDCSIQVGLKDCVVMLCGDEETDEAIESSLSTLRDLGFGASFNSQRDFELSLDINHIANSIIKEA